MLYNHGSLPSLSPSLLSPPPFSLPLPSLSPSLLSPPPFSLPLPPSPPPFSLPLPSLSPSLLSPPPFSLPLPSLSPSLLSPPPFSLPLPSLSPSLPLPLPSLSPSLPLPLPSLSPSLLSPPPFSLPLPSLSPPPFSLSPSLLSPPPFSLPLPPYRFDTGFLILSLMMDKKEQFASWLPVEQLWPLLIGVACQHTGQERLKVIGLLMELINFQSSKEGEGDGWKKKMQLSALKPLWQLYTTIIKDYGKYFLVYIIVKSNPY